MHEIKTVGMEGKKNDRPAWINKVFDQFLEDFEADRDPTIKIKDALNDLEQGRIDQDLLKIKVKLAKDPADYAVNNPNKKIGVLLGAKAGDVIWYYNTDKGVSINPDEISVLRYKAMLLTTVKDALEILGYWSSEKMQLEVLRTIRKLGKNNRRSNISSNSLLSALSMSLRNGFHSSFSIARVILNDGTVLPIKIKIQNLHKW